MAQRPYYTTANYGVKNSVGYLLRRARNLLHPGFEKLFEHQELTFSQWAVLMALRDNLTTSAAEIARNLCHDAGSLTRLIDQLEKRGLLKRKRSTRDRRVVTLALTPRGRTLVESLVPRAMAFWNETLSDFTHQEIAMLIALLGRLVAKIEAADTTPRRRRKP